MISKLSIPLLTAVLAGTLAAGLSGCVPLVLGGAAVSAMVVVDRRTPGAQLDDEEIELRGASRVREALADRGHVNITSYNRQVLLTGEVPNEAAKQQAEQILSRVENVRSIVNELAPMANTTLAQRSSDALITGKVKASFVDAKDLYAGAFKVVTERSAVFLMGRVTQRESDRATAIARQVNGVQRVVRVFEIIDEAEMHRIQLQAPTTSSTPLPPMAPLPSSEPASPRR